MTVPSGYRAIDIPIDRSVEMLDIGQWGFAMHIPAAGMPAILGAIPWDRARGVEVDDLSKGVPSTIVGVHSSYPMRVRVPGGGDIAASGLTWVSVHPGHRRRGILRSMIEDHMSRSLSRGEPISILYAAETKIYQRFGYGLASMGAVLELGRAPELRAIPGADQLHTQLASADLSLHGEIVRAVQARMARPGTIVSVSDALLADQFVDVDEWREGAERLRFAWVDDASGPAAFAIFSRKGKWEQGGPEGETSVRAWGAATGASMQRLFSVVTDLDLMSSCKVGRVAIDSPLFAMLVDPRGVTPKLADNLWVRILDVPAALTGRGYSSDIDITIEVADPMITSNSQRWRLVARAGQQSAHIERAERDAPAHVRLGIQELSAAYLGGQSIEALCVAGLVEELHVGAIPALARAMRATDSPMCNLGF